MAKQRRNVVTHGLSGKVGGILIFRQTATGTVIQSPPRMSGEVSESQRAHRRKFQRAVLYANVVEQDPATKEVYASKAKKGQTARNVAVADFLRAPDIEVIDVSGYHGQPGDTIRIEVTDDFAVKEVKVVISDPDGILIEEGYAIPEITGYEWTYTATSINESVKGDRIEIFASDTPGNITHRTDEL
jgi:hypothetical protein